MTARAPVRKSTAQGTRWIYRWLYVQGDDGKSITNACIILFPGTKPFVCVKAAVHAALPFAQDFYICCNKISKDTKQAFQSL